MFELMLVLAGCPADSDTSGDSAKPDTVDTGETGETGSVETGETGETGIEDPCPEGVVATFVPVSGDTVDVTAELLAGTYLTLDQPGTLSVCPGTWFARVVVRAEVSIVGLGAGPEDTILSAGQLGTILDASATTMTVSNLTLDRGAGLDVAHNSGGGGIYCDGYGSVVVDSVVFSNNYANDGAGLYVSDCEVAVSHSVFEDNLSDDDGGAFTMWYSNGTLDDVTFRNNTGLDGGAMALMWGSVTMTNVVFEDNESSFRAGAAWFYNMDVNLSDTTFSNNLTTGEQAGAVELDGTGILERVTFSDNVTSIRGGGLYLYWEAVVEATDCTLSGNTPDDLWVADYSAEEGSPHTIGGEVDFSCAGNVCTGI